MANITARVSKKDGKISYRIKVFIGYDINNKQIIKSLTWTPDENMSKRQIEKEVNRQAVLFEQKCKQGRCINDNIRFSELADLWMSDYAEKNLKNTTISSYKKLLLNILPSIGHISIGKLQPHDLNVFYNSLLSRKIETNAACVPKIDFERYVNVHNGKKVKKARIQQTELAEKSGVSLRTVKKLFTDEHISIECAKKICAVLEIDYKKSFEEVERNYVKASTVKRYHALISSICTFAVLQNIIVVNPCSRVKPPKVQKNEADYLDEDETAMLLEKLQTAPQPFRTAMQLLLFTGMRRGEMCGIEWSDIDVEKNIIHIRRNVLYTQENGVYEDTPKTKSSVRDVKISEHIIALLDDYREWQKEQQDKCCNQWHDSKRIFTNDLGVPIHPTSVSKWFRDFNDKNGLRHIPLHSLRHTSASILVMSGVPMNVVSKRLGHASTSTTCNIYTHVLRSADAMAAQALDGIIFNKTKEGHLA